MITLAIELSSAQASLALLSDGQVLAGDTWNDRDVPDQELFRRLPPILAAAGVSIGSVDLFAAGRGPGSYSGLRIAVTAAQALALPSGKPFFTVSSGEALAQEIADRERASAVAVVGDARRGTLWIGVFEARGSEFATEKPWSVVRAEDLASVLPEGCVAVTPDWDRLSSVIQAHPAPRARWIAGNSCPKALWVGRIAAERFHAGAASEPPTPIYMHPAVAKAPAG